MATNWVPPLLDIRDKTNGGRFFQVASKIYGLGAIALVDVAGNQTAAQITETLNRWVESRQPLPSAVPVVEIVVTTI